MADDSTAAPGSTPAPSSLLQNLLPGILSRAKVVVSPYPFATQDDDSLRVTVVNSLTNVSVEVHGRLVTRDGVATPFRYVVTPTSNRVASTQDFHLAGGFVSNLSAFAAGAAPLIGQTFVIVQIIRGAGASAFVLGTLLSAYVTATQPIGWPGTPISNSLDTGGYYRSVTGTAPPAGGQIIETTPTGARWLLRGVRFTFTTDATPGNRQVFLSYHDTLSALAGNVHAPLVQGASASVVYSFIAGWTPASLTFPSGTQFSNLPDAFMLLAGWNFNFQAANIAVADQFSAPVYEVQEQLEAA